MTLLLQVVFIQYMSANLGDGEIRICYTLQQEQLTAIKITNNIRSYIVLTALNYLNYSLNSRKRDNC